MKIRPATPGDLDAAVSVKVEAIRPVYEPTQSPALASDYDVDHQTEWLAHLLATMDEDSPFLVAVDDIDLVVGWIRVGRDWEDDEASAEIRGLFVSPSRQGGGVGRQLVSEGCRLLHRLGYRRIKVQTLAGSPACAFYERLGGRHAGVSHSEGHSQRPCTGGMTSSWRQAPDHVPAIRSTRCRSSAESRRFAYHCTWSVAACPPSRERIRSCAAAIASGARWVRSTCASSNCMSYT